jgi:hypothetical protein
VVETVVEEFLGEDLADGGFFVEVVEEWDVEARGDFEGIGERAQNAHEDEFSGGSLLDDLQKDLLSY